MAFQKPESPGQYLKRGGGGGRENDNVRLLYVTPWQQLCSSHSLLNWPDWESCRATAKASTRMFGCLRSLGSSASSSSVELIPFWGLMRTSLAPLKSAQIFPVIACVGSPKGKKWFGFSAGPP